MPGVTAVERAFWTDGDLVHVVHVGFLRFQSFCGQVPVFLAGLREQGFAKCDGPPTCIECTANERSFPCRP